MGGLGENRIRELNDEINKLIRQNKKGELRILELGGPNYTRGSSTSELMKTYEKSDSKNTKCFPGYVYFGASRNLHGVKELFEKDLHCTPDSVETSHNKVSIEYYGFFDEEDGVLLSAESKQEKKLPSVGK